MHITERVRRAVFALPLALVVGVAHGGPDPVVGGPLLDEIATMPAGTWRLVNRNAFSSAWTPAALRPLNRTGNPTPDKIIGAWSGFAWDARRGDLILYGGGHANYSGNDVYRFRSSTLSWERASLPSEIAQVFTSNAYMAIDGADAAPASAHTYDNNLYLPVIDRFLTFGGAVYNTGGVYLRPDELQAGVTRRTGPYLFDPARADPWQVGGTTGSHVRRVAPYPEITGGLMWENRDHARNLLPGSPQPGRHVNGCTAYSEENGADVVYVAGPTSGGTNPDLYRYAFGAPGAPHTDSTSKVGMYWNGAGGQSACGYDPVRRLFVRTGSNARPFAFWDLGAAGPQNRDVRVDANASIASFVAWLAERGRVVSDCGLDFDPVDGTFPIWCGTAQVWKLRPPPDNVAAGWTIQALPLPAGGPTASVGVGILGKWKYVPGFDVYIALQDSTAGNVWVYKPAGWTAPGPGDAVNFAPRASLDAPSAGAVLTLGQPATLAASAIDPDGSVTRVDFYASGVLVGSRTAPPYAISWTPSGVGAQMLQARAVDNEQAEGASAAITVQVIATNVPPTVSMQSPAPGTSVLIGNPVPLAATASDTDGSIVRVAFLANGQVIGEDSSAPYNLVWTPPSTGSWQLVARATDNGGLSVDSAPIAISVTSPPPGQTTITLQQDVSGYTAMTDTMLSSYHPATSFGARTILLSQRGRYANLFRFPVFQSEGGPVPDAAVIQSARLAIHKQAYNQVFRAHALLKDWDEAQATWQNARAGVAWTVAGASGVDSDYEAAQDAEASAPYAAGWIEFDVTSRVRAWGAGMPNFGWRLVPVSGASGEIKLMSSEYTDAPALRPRLTVTYVLP